MTRSRRQPRRSDQHAGDAAARSSIREDLLTNVLVEAGAGSGKTQMLAERMAAGVATGVYAVEHMAAVTFTRKAAAELRGRFHLALEAKLREQRESGKGGDDGGVARLNAALGNLERFFAGTIHSFCARLLRERPVEAGVSPGFVELDEVQDLELQRRVWRDFVASTRAAGDPEMTALLETGVRPHDLDPAFATICLNGDVEFPPGDGACPDPKPAVAALERFWRELQRHLPDRIDPHATCKIQQAAVRFRRQFRVARHRLDRPSVVASLLEGWKGKSEITLWCWADTAAGKKKFKELIPPLHADFVQATVDPFLAQWRHYVYRLAVGLLTRARDHAAAERRRLNTLNYGDLLVLAARVLRENPQVRRALQRKYRFLFVDEFQDTDPLQAEIVFLLAADETVASGFSRTEPAVSGFSWTNSASNSTSMPVCDWRRVALRPGALFVVGDPKQSIYRFRRADIEIYNIVRTRFEELGGRVLRLTKNFRSVPELCDWANDVFRTRFPEAPTAYSPQFAALDADESAERAAARPAHSTGVFTLTHAPGRNGSVIHDDAARIARFIRAEVDGGRRRYSDFLVLTRKKAQRIVPYAKALEALNIPIEVSGAGAFGDAVEVATLRTLLRALVDTQDDVALVAVLRGPLFGISDRELYAYRQSGGRFSIFAGEPAVDAAVDTEETGGGVRLQPDQPRQSIAADSVRHALTALRQYYRWTRLLPAAAALERILEHTGYLALATTMPGGVEAGDLLHAVDRVRQVVEDGGSLSDAADSLEEDAEETSEVESLPLEPGKTDVVRIMNLHKAKGLEATVVFLADPTGGFPPRVDVHIERTGAIARGWFRVVKKSDEGYTAKVLGVHADWPQHEAAERPYLEHEQDRLLYVAATRAREMLVVSRAPGAKSSAWGVLDPFLTGVTELRVPASVSVAPAVLLDCSPVAQAEAHAARAAAHERLKQPSWSVTSVTAEARHVARMVEQPEPATDDPTRVVETDTPTHRADVGMAWGTLIHGLLEHAMRFPTATREDLRRMAMWLTVEEPKLRGVIEEAVETVERVRGAEFWREARQTEHYVESPFAVMLANRSLLTGTIDLVHRQDVSWSIVDYKTDVAGQGPNSEAYAAQIAQYARALEACGLTVGTSKLVRVRSDGSSEGTTGVAPQQATQPADQG